MNPAPTVNTGYDPIEKLSALLTPAQVFKFVQQAVPELKLAHASLQHSLINQQWADASKQAHRLKSTISLLSVDSLVHNLDLIESADSTAVESSDFRELVASQCQQLVDSLESYLNNKPD